MDNEGSESNPLTSRSRLLQSDWVDVLPVFRTIRTDYDDLMAMISKRYGVTSEVTHKIGRATEAILRIEAGKPPVFEEMKLLQARHVLAFLIAVGKMEVARKYMLSAAEKWNGLRFKSNFNLLFDYPQNGGMLEHVDQQWLDFQAFDFGGKTTVMLFCGVTHKFGIELNVLMPWLQKFDVNVIYLRDFSGSLYLKGIKSLGDLDATILKIRETLAAMGTERLVCMGNSGGTYGALYYGHLIPANQVLCFAGPTNLDVGFQEKADRPLYERLKEQIDAGLLDEPDLIDCYRNNNVKVRYFHGDGHQFDVFQAARLKGLPNVSVEPLEDWKTHFVIGELAARNLLNDIFDSAFRL